MDFTYKPVVAYKGWWKVSDLPIGVEFRFDMRKIKVGSGKFLTYHNSCYLLTRISEYRYETEYRDGLKSRWDVSDTSGPYIEIHII